MSTAHTRSASPGGATHPAVRPASRTASAPRSRAQAAVCRPMPPRPPVISTVPLRRAVPGCGGNATRRGTKRPCGRRATTGSASVRGASSSSNNRIRGASRNVDAAAAQLRPLHCQGGGKAGEHRSRRIADRWGGAAGDEGNRLRGDEVLTKEGQGLGQIGPVGRYREHSGPLAEAVSRSGGLPLESGDSWWQTVA